MHFMAHLDLMVSPLLNQKGRVIPAAAAPLGASNSNAFYATRYFSSASGTSNASTSKPSKEAEAGSKSEKDFDLYDFVESDEEQPLDSTRYVTFLHGLS